MTTNLRRYLDDETEAMRAAAVPRIRTRPVGEPVRDVGPWVPLPWARDLATVGKPLSRRELELLETIRDGHTNKEAAFLMGCTEQTVKNYMTSILTKMAATDRTHAVVKGIQEGVIPLVKGGDAGAVGLSPSMVQTWCDDIDARLTAIDGYVERLRGWLAEARFQVKAVAPESLPTQPKPEPVPGICVVADCGAPVAAKSPGPGRPPTKCERHVHRRVALVAA